MTLQVTESSLRERIEEILPRVARPARYTGGELNSVRKPTNAVSVRIALAFPDVYEVGMSNLGLRILYHALNSVEHVAAERVFAPAPDMDREMRDARIPLFSLESSIPVRDFDLVGFSLAYEMTFTTVLHMLDLAGIPLFARDRTGSDPIIVAGGHCAVNPEPMADFVDAFAIGDGEDVALDIVRVYEANRGDRTRALSAMSRVEGVYVPSMSADGAERPAVRARRVLDLDAAPFPERLVVPFTQTVHDRAALEIMRGCSRGCRFCQAGMITRPVRERSPGTLCRQAGVILENTGYDEVALTSLSSADHHAIGELVTALIDRHGRDGVGVSLPSLRADAECVLLADQIQRVRKSGLTFAPEAGTQRLRDVINKNVSEEDLLAAVDAAVECGWRRIKLYFMIGLPTETDDDIAGIGELVSKVAGIGRARGRPLNINVTISPFVPKAHTPFQWRAMVAPEELERRVSLVRSMLRGRNVSLSWHDPHCSRVEAALARGDRKLGSVVYEAWKRGARLEQDGFEWSRWAESFEVAGLNIADYANRELPRDAALPWDFVEVGVSKRFLAAEDERAERGETTPDCRSGICSACGLSETISPEPCLRPLGAKTALAPPPERPARAASGSRALLIKFAKSAELRWIGHLDLVRVFERAVRMSGIAAAYTQGFNPRVKMSIASALPLGATADGELLTIHVEEPVDPRDVVSRLSRHLPEGLSLREARVVPSNAKGPVVKGSEYEALLRLPENAGAEDIRSAAAALLGRTEIPRMRESGGKRRKVDLRPGIESLEVADSGPERAVVLRMRIPSLDFSVRPAEIVELISEIVPGVELMSLHRTRLLTQSADR